MSRNEIEESRNEIEHQVSRNSRNEIEHQVSRNEIEHQVSRNEIKHQDSSYEIEHLEELTANAEHELELDANLNEDANLGAENFENAEHELDANLNEDANLGADDFNRYTDFVDTQYEDETRRHRQYYHDEKPLSVDEVKAHAVYMILTQSRQIELKGKLMTAVLNFAARRRIAEDEKTDPTNKITKLKKITKFTHQTILELIALRKLERQYENHTAIHDELALMIRDNCVRHHTGESEELLIASPEEIRLWSQPQIVEPID